MRTIREYHRPATLGEALILLARTDVDSVPLGGGTVLNGLPDDVPEEVVDLQSLGLDNIGRDGATLDGNVAKASLSNLASANTI